MTINRIKQFINEEDTFLREFYWKNAPEEQITYNKVVKIMEELGELSDIVLKSYKKQRTTKLAEKDTTIEQEIADVLIVTLLLAKHLKIDSEKAILEKIEKIENRRDKLPS